MPAELKAADRKGLLMYGISGVLTITAQILTIASMSYIPVSISALITLCSPVLVFLLCYIVLRNQERITLRLVLGSVLTLAGIAVIVLR